MNATDATRVFASRTFSARAVPSSGASWLTRAVLALLVVLVIALAIVVIIPITILVIAWFVVRGTLRVIFGSLSQRTPRSGRATVAPATAATPIDAEFDVIDTAPIATETGRQNVRVRQTN